MSSDKSQFAEAEEKMLSLWEKEQVFEKSVDRRKGQKLFSFYDGPPFANGQPHWGGMMTSVLKDAICRYKTMQGYYVPRRFGWDCHGLPPELEVEKQLDVHGKKAIQAYGVDKFVNACRASVLQYTGIWHHYVSRIGRWVDFDDDYRTMDTSYTESVWWAFKTLHDKGLIYEGVRVVPYSYGAETALSTFETRLDDSYREREDIAVTFTAELSDGRIALVWTTAPWTIPANLLLAINREIKYVDVTLNGVVYVLAADSVERYKDVLGKGKVSKPYSGEKLSGLTYTPVFPYFSDAKNSFRLVHADFVETESGTGVVSIAPGHGEDDFWTGKKEKVPIVSPVDDQGRFTSEVKDYAGRLVFDANNELVADLERVGKAVKTELYKHMYPHCWRTDVPIIYRAMSAWFVDVPKIKDDLLKANKQINWYPAHVKEGAFGKWLENAREWNISRKRFWGAPIPVWKTDDGELIVIGSVQELKSYIKNDISVSDLHRPWIDNVTLTLKDGRVAKRVDDVFDCWFESGSMPFASIHYPFENKDKFEAGNPADFITEYIGQTRGWFYTLHVMSVALFGKPAFKNSVAHGIILGTDGRKMSKRLGNYPALEEVFNNQGADAVRLYLLGSSLFSGETAVFDPQALTEALRNLVQRFNNSYTFFKTYTDVDSWKPAKHLKPPEVKNALDHWILSRLGETVAAVTESADEYATPRAIKVLFELVDDLSNWYIRRSRRRFWKSEDDGDKQAAYETLHYLLTVTSQLLAPWAPFISDKVYQDLTDSMDLPKSVHLSDWPKPQKSDKKVLQEMSEAREYINQGLAQRAAAGIKVRQPLSKVSIPELSEEYADIIAEELNVKQVNRGKVGSKVVLDTTITDSLRAEGIMRDLVRHIQNARKQAGLEVSDRIDLVVEPEDELTKEALKTHEGVIKQETLALTLNEHNTFQFETQVKIEGQLVRISLEKVKK
jgi:isoleucyl-tRNA synthetase